MNRSDAVELHLERFDRARHDRGSFDCGVDALNTYLKTSLGQQHRRDVTRGYVLADDRGRVAGFFTLSAGLLRVGAIPGGHGFPVRMPLPTTLLGRLAVDLAFRGRGLGERMLVEALRLAVETSEIVASAVIEVDAKDESARAFYQNYGFQSLPDDREHMYLPMATARKVFEEGR
ncbi:MAG: GNAT family N-acetyltransferase [Phycisphaeraceae bacterium]|nr:MAG: GNAT family N-acetyltransferase [Phycisphaeraceae bacterium]